MPTTSGKAFVMERRTFLKLSAAAALAGTVMDYDTAAAEGMCLLLTEIGQASASAAFPAAVNSAGKELLYWIDGPMNAGLPGYSGSLGGLETRARLSCTMVVPHNALSYVESVSLVESDRIISQIFYGPNVSSITGMAPYTVFEDLDLDINKQYKIVYVIASGNGEVTAYVHVISNPEPSRFDYLHLSHLNGAERQLHYLRYIAMELSATNAYHFSNNDAKNGYVTTPYGQTSGGPHTCRARILKIEPLGAKDSANNLIEGNFEIEFDLMHADTSSEAHYMRYFLVLDPVGRILGGVRRLHGDGVTRKVLVKRGFHTPLYMNQSAGPSANIAEVYRDSYGKGYGRLHGSVQSDRLNPSIRQQIQPLTASEVQQHIKSLNILDCPFVSLYVDDRFHSISKSCIRLR